MLQYIKNSRRVQEGLDAVIVDTAGRLQIDDRLMGELAAAKKAIKPTDTLLVVDAMTGQEAATLVRAFNEAAPITGAHLGTPAGCIMPFRSSVSGQYGHVCTSSLLQ